MIVHSKMVIFRSNMLIFYSENVISIVFCMFYQRIKQITETLQAAAWTLVQAQAFVARRCLRGSSLEATLFPIFIEKHDGE